MKYRTIPALLAALSFLVPAEAAQPDGPYNRAPSPPFTCSRPVALLVDQRRTGCSFYSW
jgi:hypothetical protein